MRIIPFLVVGLIALAGAGIYKVRHPLPTAQPAEDTPEKPDISAQETARETATPENPVPLGGPFSLIDQQGIQRTDASFADKTLIVYFGYSYCPDICPMALFTLSEVMEELDPQGERFQPLFITVDPGRDTVANLALYAQNFHPRFVMLTGSETAVKAAMKAYRVYAAAVPKEGSTEVLIDHSSVIYVMSPLKEGQRQFLTHFNHTTPKDAMLKGLSEG